jgi:transposase
MPKAYPLELRQRVVGAYEEGEGTYNELAAVYRVGRATVDRWLARFRTVGSVASAGHRGGHPSRVDEEGQRAIRAWIHEVPDLSLQELIAKYIDVFAVPVSKSAMSRTLQRLGLTRKKRPSTRPNATRLG